MRPTSQITKCHRVPYGKPEQMHDIRQTLNTEQGVGVPRRKAAPLAAR